MRWGKIETDRIINRDCFLALKEMPDESVHCCVTSPPYYGLRDYGMDGQIGREKKLVTYPRTDSRYLSDDMAQTAENVIKAVFDSGLLEREVVYSPDIKRVCNSKRVSVKKGTSCYNTTYSNFFDGAYKICF